MKLFSKKEAKPELPPLKFPEFPKEEPKIPAYEQGISPAEAASIKQAITMPGLEIPIRKPMPVRPTFTEKPAYTAPEHERETQKRGQTLFIKMERYKEAIIKMEHIKETISEAEKILRKLDEIKRQEDEELARWHQDLEVIKSKILSIDNSLFEG
ncbi:MAG: hypothetical protein Q8N77_05500 [Nanoarchaeota archaeon]|nr:hypothetical protein [Nanoarchaeota archaeon]